MKKMLLISTIGLLLMAHALSEQLVAADRPMTREAVEKRIAELEGKLEKLGKRVEKLEKSGKEFSQRVDARTQKIKELAGSHWNLSDEFQDRLALLQSGNEAAELKALDGVEKLGDEGTILLAFAADRSSHKSVRRKALATALKMGENGYPAIAHAFKGLSEEDRLFLVGEIAKKDAPERMPALASMSGDPSKKVRMAALKAGCKLKDRLGFLALYAKNSEDDPKIDELLTIVDEFKGEEGVMLLYAAASADDPKLVVGVLRAAEKRGVSALPVLKPAFERRESAVRAQVVRTAKKLGGPVADFVIDRALSDGDPKLREAAEKAFQEKEEPEKVESAGPAKLKEASPMPGRY